MTNVRSVVLERFVAAAALTVLGVAVWLRTYPWGMADAAANSLPAALALPLFFFLSGPWHGRTAQTAPAAFPVVGVVMGGLLLIAGFAGDIGLLLAAGWTLLLRAAVQTLADAETAARVNRHLALVLFAFPWLVRDGQTLGWWMRLSCASVTDLFFGTLGFDVQRSGVRLLIQGLPVSVDAACSGINALQSMLVAGLTLAYVGNGAGRRWPAPVLLAVLAGMAWAANTLRVILLCAVALTFGTAFARGAFHAVGGWMVLVLMFLLCGAVFSLPRRERGSECPA